jgi:hypothetical protein
MPRPITWQTPFGIIQRTCVMGCFDEAYMSISAIPAAAISHWNRSLSGPITLGSLWTIVTIRVDGDSFTFLQLLRCELVSRQRERNGTTLYIPMVLSHREHAGLLTKASSHRTSHLSLARFLIHGVALYVCISQAVSYMDELSSPILVMPE